LNDFAHVSSLFFLKRTVTQKPDPTKGGDRAEVHCTAGRKHIDIKAGFALSFYGVPTRGKKHETFPFNIFDPFGGVCGPDDKAGHD
jgi:hypothetical protein